MRLVPFSTAMLRISSWLALVAAGLLVPGTLAGQDRYWTSAGAGAGAEAPAAPPLGVPNRPPLVDDARPAVLPEGLPSPGMPLPGAAPTGPPLAAAPPAGPLPEDLTAVEAAPWCGAIGTPLGGGLEYHAGGQARGYYLNDQRIEFTGLEATFAVEGVVEGGLSQSVAGWQHFVEAQLFFNQPFDRNILVDSPVRRSFAPNFDFQPVEISQLYLGVRRDDWLVALGRFVTPFGRFYYPLYRNNFDDSPFIRSDAILYRETGLLVEWSPGSWNLTAALTNGGLQQDANSSKALVARLGYDGPWFAVGASIKAQDGIGSESQKTYNEHLGLDAMLRRGPWTLSAEVIADRYGLRRPGFDPLDIFWGRSLYFRDLNKGYHEPIRGVGYYVNLGYEGPHWSLTFNYGDFFPESLGVPAHDQPIHRGLIKASRFWTRHFETYGIAFVENRRDDGLDSHPRDGLYLVLGCQFTL